MFFLNLPIPIQVDSLKMDAMQGQLSNQYSKLMALPQIVLNNWPAMITFAIVDYVSETIFRALPLPTGYAGFAARKIIDGARDVTKMATWDVAKGGV